MKKLLFLISILYSINIHADNSLKPLNFKNQASKSDLIVASLYSRLSCKVNYLGNSPNQISKSKVEPELCLSDINYLPNTKTIRMYFVITDNHFLVEDFEQLNHENKSKVILAIAKRVEKVTIAITRKLSLLTQHDRLKIEFLLSHSDYRVLRNNQGEIQLLN